MFAFHIHQPLVAAGLVLVLMNVATIFPLWPGNVGLTQAAIALPLVNYGVDYARGIAFGIGLQLIEASVGIGIGLVFLAREGLSYAMLKRMEEDDGGRRSRSSPSARSASRSLTEPSMLALASPASLKGVLSPLDAAASLATGLRSVAGSTRARRRSPTAAREPPPCCTRRSAASWRRRRSPIRSAGPSTARWLVLADGTAVVEAAAAIGLPLVEPDERDPLAATSRGLGELILAVLAGEPPALLVGLGGTATVDGGAGMRDVVGERLRALRSAQRVTSATRCSARAARPACSGRRRAPTRRRSRSSNAGSPR